MPVQKGKASFDFSRSLSAHAQDETDYGREFINLPAGISGGIAKVVDCKIGKIKTGKNAGNQFFYAAAVVVSPKTAVEIIKALDDKGKPKVISSRELNIEGQRTSIMIPLCDTQGKNGEISTADEKVASMLNELRKIGGEECTSDVDSEESLEALMNALKEKGPYIRFSTSGGDPTPEYPNPRVWENWHGSKGLEDYVQEESSGVVDNTPSANGTPTQEPDGSDLDSLAEAADDAEDRSAMKILREKATEAGVDKEDIDNADSWKDVVEMIRGKESDHPQESDEPQSSDPEKGQACYYKPIDPKTKKPVKKGIEVEVVLVDKKAKTVTLKRLDNRTMVKGVKWDLLSDEE